MDVQKGSRYGRYTVIGDSQEMVNGRNQWLCKCDCGVEKYVRNDSLVKGTTVSCGCYRKDKIKEAVTKHGRYSGAYKKPLQRVYEAMMTRCYSPGYVAYDRYGGRGITVCERWHTYEFFEKDMGEKPSKLHSLDRIDNTKGYSPDNCRWATKKEQTRNRDRSLTLTYKEETKTLAEWAETVGLNERCLYSRIFKYKWDVEKALTTGVKRTDPYVKNVSEVRGAFGYTETPAQCGTCQSYLSRMAEGITGRDWEAEKRCTEGNFPVKKTAICDRYKRKEVE